MFELSTPIRAGPVRVNPRMVVSACTDPIHLPFWYLSGYDSWREVEGT